MKRVPSFSVLSTVTAPPCALAIQATKLRPRPEPFFRVRRWDPIEAVENVRQMAGRDAYAGVFHDQLHVIEARNQAHLHRAAGRRVFNGIA